MKKEAVITIVSNASISDGDKIEVISPGEFEIKKDLYRIKYEETELSGMEGTTTILTIKNDEVVLERIGTTETKMIFTEKDPTVSLYNTPYGMLELTIVTEKVDINVDENGGKLIICYDMAVAGQKALPTELVMDIKVK
ncbi:DUF1934 domain-containing protein [Clostridium sp. MSJ-8]|jgi:uncharacterized beta-barrel protein YwiB (DUF1934 family)|uniref:DUF1934 domain-containing protein n=1 Tax=Clostridium sp. MSJ-8 TaxID=2841510 RepID=UPI001C0F2E8E|nr:DUF1934 domain-containing protein [Clostridium sp. MSJ-8]MBU5488538.1 DUF1934 domain-containing protein [Clostridium sp. MSJ-8]